MASDNPLKHGVSTIVSNQVGHVVDLLRREEGFQIEDDPRLFERVGGFECELAGLHQLLLGQRGGNGVDPLSPSSVMRASSSAMKASERITLPLWRARQTQNGGHRGIRMSSIPVRHMRWSAISTA
jgi:hypothetical protein